MKNVPAEEWIEKPADATKSFEEFDLSYLNIKYYRDIKFDIKRTPEDGEVKPISPFMGPVIVPNPKIHDKIYRWCSCGQSLKQPFCDNSHKGTSYKPFKFTV
jgi:hypothetical protein